MIATNTSVLSTSTEIGDSFDFLFDPEEKPLKQNPHGFVMEPVYSAFEENPELVGFLIGVTVFGRLLDQLLPEGAGANGIVCVFKDKCGNAITYELNGPVQTYLGAGDLHDPQFDKYERSSPVEVYKTDFEGRCAYELYIYPSTKFRETYMTKNPTVYTSVVAVAFFVTSVLIIMYDWCVLSPLITVFFDYSFLKIYSQNPTSSIFSLSCEGWSLDDKIKRWSLSSKPTDSSRPYSLLTSAIKSWTKCLMMGEKRLFSRKARMMRK
jgi:hypothetical protein